MLTRLKFLSGVLLIIRPMPHPAGFSWLRWGS